ncbi:MAG: MBOAT family protein [Gammaproteobacteria bacterium]|nr:MBOAT family protein [Gammaproteobacteria bacterium]
MLFNSVAFVFWFLPIVLFGFFAVGRYNQKAASGWLVAAAFFFYGYWNTNYISLLVISIVVNYLFGYGIGQLHEKRKPNFAKLLFIVALVVDLSVLGYYKYSKFFVSQIDALIGAQYFIENIALPLGISFFTFTQIAFLVDVYQKKAKEHDLLRYFLFVTYFPHLIAGPIIHHAEMMPQFADKKTYQFSKENFSIGVLIFTVGLAKKVLLADNIAPYADGIFAASGTATHVITFAEGWKGALSYTLQLYFDFSGYCDMAIGLSKMFNILLPINFNSPYKSLNMIEFWRRWHITLSRFLRDYLYIPLGGNRHGDIKRYRNLLATMILGGLWHGASWTFILWGTLHGSYLAINHLWSTFLQKQRYANVANKMAYKAVAWMLTLTAVVVAWVFFRADNFHSALNVLSGMVGLHGLSGAADTTLPLFPKVYFTIAIVLCLLMPNTQQIFARFHPGLETYPGDITPIAWLKYFNWASFVKIRWLGYLWVSYLASAFLMMLFYSTNIDAKIFQHFPKKGRSTDVNLYTGDLRSNLFSNDIFYGNKHKVIIVGSSYTELMGGFTFNKNGIAYKTGTAGHMGNSLTNGFRTAAIILQNFKTDTLIFGVSVLGFGDIMTNPASAPTLDDQCLDSLSLLGFHREPKPFKECERMHLSAQNMAEILFMPGDSRFFQFHNFLNRVATISLGLTDLYFEKSSSYTPDTLKGLDQWYQNMKSEAALKHLDPPVVNNGNDKDFHWLNRHALESMNANGEVYQAFKELKKLADAKGVRLVIYNSPTVTAAEAPHIYPKGFIDAYRTKLRATMAQLNIPYYDFNDEFIWDGRYTSDFIHISGEGRRRIHAKLIDRVFFKENV